LSDKLRDLFPPVPPLLLCFLSLAACVSVTSLIETELVVGEVFLVDPGVLTDDVTNGVLAGLWLDTRELFLKLCVGIISSEKKGDDGGMQGSSNGGAIDICWHCPLHDSCMELSGEYSKASVERDSTTSDGV
jgi:hypothetical protein